jgi:hypothetical protein
MNELSSHLSIDHNIRFSNHVLKIQGLPFLIFYDGLHQRWTIQKSWKIIKDARSLIKLGC